MEIIDDLVRNITTKTPPIYGTETKNIHFQDMPTSLILLTVSGRATQILPKNNNKPIEEMIYIGIDMATEKLELTPLVRAIAERNKT